MQTLCGANVYVLCGAMQALVEPMQDLFGANAGPLWGPCRPFEELMQTLLGPMQVLCAVNGAVVWATANIWTFIA